MSNKKSNAGKNVGKIGLGIVAAGTAAAGAYYLYGSKNAVKNRKKASAWARKAEMEIENKAKKSFKIAKSKIGAELGRELKKAQKTIKSMKKSK